MQRRCLQRGLYRAPLDREGGGVRAANSPIARAAQTPWLRQLPAWQGPEPEHPRQSRMELGRRNIPAGDSGKRTEHLGYGEGKIVHLCEKRAGEFTSR